MNDNINQTKWIIIVMLTAIIFTIIISYKELSIKIKRVQLIQEERIHPRIEELENRMNSGYNPNCIITEKVECKCGKVKMICERPQGTNSLIKMYCEECSPYKEK